MCERFRVDVGKVTVVAGAFSIVNFDHSPLAWEWQSWDGSLKGVWVRCVAAIEVVADSGEASVK